MNKTQILLNSHRYGTVPGYRYNKHCGLCSTQPQSPCQYTCSCQCGYGNVQSKRFHQEVRFFNFSYTFKILSVIFLFRKMVSAQLNRYRVMYTPVRRCQMVFLFRRYPSKQDGTTYCRYEQVPKSIENYGTVLSSNKEGNKGGRWAGCPDLKATWQGVGGVYHLFHPLLSKSWDSPCPQAHYNITTWLWM